MNIVFFETKDHSNQTLKDSFPDATFSNEILDPSSALKHKDAEIICIDISKVNDESLKDLPNLKYIVTRSTGYDHIDTAYCRTRNIPVSNVPSYGSVTVAEQTFALMLTLTRKIYQAVTQVKDGNFDLSNLTGVDLNGKTLGIIGMGKIGEHVLRIATGFQMNVKVFSEHRNEKLLSEFPFEFVDFDELISTSDIVTIHVPFTPKTHHMINRDNITKFKKGSYLINTARGAVVETEAIIQALDNGILSGVGLDVLEEEEEFKEELKTGEKNGSKILELNHALINHPKVIVTPHNAFNSHEALKRIDETTAENIQSFLSGTPINVIN